MGLLRPRPERVVPEYLLYAFLSPAFQQIIAANTITGATVDRISLSDVPDFPIRIPGTKEQKQVASILKSIDAKIDCNNHINAELEAMAKTLYDYWFMQFDFPDANGKPYKSGGGKMVYNAELKREIPEDWDDSSIQAIANLLGGGTPTKKKSEFWGGGIPFFTPTDADGTIFKFSTADYITEEGLKGSSTKLFGKHTVFITARGSVGRLVLAGVDMAMNQSCYALRAKPDISHTFLFFMTKELIHHLQVKSSGSVFDSIVSNDIEQTKLAIPNTDLIKKFAEIAEPAFEKIANNTKENLQLAQLRDWLLPMLMNGQVTVK
jgi:type I restriction enzyme S subunit